MEVNRGYVIYLCRYELKNNHFSCQKKKWCFPKRWGLQLSEYDKGHAYLANKTIDISVAISSRLANFSGFMQGYEDSDRPCMHAVWSGFSLIAWAIYELLEI